METSPPIGQRPRILLQSGGGGPRLSPFELIVLGVVFLVSIYGSYAAYARFTDLNKAPPTAQTFAPAVRTTLTSSVSATGTANSSQQVNLTFDVGTGGGKIKEFMVKLGDQVVSGQPLAKLDDTDLAQSLKSAESALASAQARLNAAISPSTADRASSQQSIAQAQSTLSNAQKSYEDLRAGVKPADRLTAEQSVLTAQAGVQTAQNNLVKGQTTLQSDQTAILNAQNDLNSANLSVTSTYNSLVTAVNSLSSECRALVRTPIQGQTASPAPALSSPSATPVTGTCNSLSGYTTAANSYNSALSSATKAVSSLQTAQNSLVNDQNNMASLQTALQTAQVSIQTAQAKYQDTVAPPTQQEIDAAQASLESAKKSLESAQAKYDQLLNPKADTVLPLQAAVDQAAASVETAKKLLAAATITAPFDGQISQLNGDVGTQVTSSTVVFILLNPKTLRLDANIDQAYISNVRSGQTATVTFDALTGNSYQATVTAVGLTPTVQQGVVSYVGTLGIDTTRIPQGTPVPTPGMTASINIQTSRTENALAIPSRAVRRIGRNQTVTVKTPAGSEQRTVTTGATNGTLIQITSGLQDNDEVLVSTPASGSTQQAPGTGQGGPPGGVPFGPPP